MVQRKRKIESGAVALAIAKTSRVEETQFTDVPDDVVALIMHMMEDRSCIRMLSLRFARLSASVASQLNLRSGCPPQVLPEITPTLWSQIVAACPELTSLAVFKISGSSKAELPTCTTLKNLVLRSCYPMNRVWKPSDWLFSCAPNLTDVTFSAATKLTAPELLKLVPLLPSVQRLKIRFEIIISSGDWLVTFFAPLSALVSVKFSSVIYKSLKVEFEPSLTTALAACPSLESFVIKSVNTSLVYGRAGALISKLMAMLPALHTVDIPWVDLDPKTLAPDVTSRLQHCRVSDRTTPDVLDDLPAVRSFQVPQFLWRPSSQKTYPLLHTLFVNRIPDRYLDLRMFPALRSLELSGHDVPCVVRILNTCPTIETLSVFLFDNRNAPVGNLLTVFPALKSLQILDVHGSSAVGDLISRMPNLEKLILKTPKMTLQQPLPNLRFLQVTLGSDISGAIRSVASYCPDVRELRLLPHTSSCISPSDQDLISILTACQQLRRLFVEDGSKLTNKVSRPLVELGKHLDVVVLTDLSTAIDVHTDAKFMAVFVDA